MSRFQKDSGTPSSSKLSIKLISDNFLILCTVFLTKSPVTKLVTPNLPKNGTENQKINWEGLIAFNPPQTKKSNLGQLGVDVFAYSSVYQHFRLSMCISKTIVCYRLFLGRKELYKNHVL